MTTYAQGYTPTPDDDEIWKKLQEDLMPLGGPGMQDRVFDPNATPTPLIPAAGPAPAPQAPTPAPERQVATNPPASIPTPVLTTPNPMAAPPPPPPPPSPPPAPAAAPPMTGSGVPQTMEMAGTGAGGLAADLESYARNWMGEPNRFLSDLVTSTREAGDLRRAEARNAGVSNIDELMSSRGIVGSSVEADIRSDLERKLAADVSAEETELRKMLASYEAQDRLAGGEFGLDVAQFGQTGGIAGRELDLRAQELMQQAELEGRSLDIEEARNLAQQELEGRALDQQESQFGRSLGISQQEVDLRAKELMDRAALEGRSLDITEARDQANQDLAREGMEHEFKLHTSSIAQRESEFARSIGLDERQFIAQQEQFAQQYSEQIASRLQQNDQFRATLESEDARFAISSGLQGRALDLQAEGMTMDEAFRRASLEQERELTTSAQELTRLGLDQNDAYRYAALSQDSEFRARALDLQEQGMGLDEAYRQSELEFRERDATRRDQTTKMAILAQVYAAIAQYGGSANTKKLIDALMGEEIDPPPPPPGPNPGPDDDDDEWTK